MADIKTDVGFAAGEVWQALSNEGPQTISQLRKKLNGSSEVLDFALGWLAREDKVEITPEKKSYRVSLR